VERAVGLISALTTCESKLSWGRSATGSHKYAGTLGGFLRLSTGQWHASTRFYRVLSVDDFPHRKIVLADLTAFLLAFIEVFGRPLVEFASVIDRGGQLVLEPSNSGISVLKLGKNIVMQKPNDLLKLLIEVPPPFAGSSSCSWQTGRGFANCIGQRTDQKGN
jgi:hypothetical protein